MDWTHVPFLFFLPMIWASDARQMSIFLLLWKWNIIPSPQMNLESWHTAVYHKLRQQSLKNMIDSPVIFVKKNTKIEIENNNNKRIYVSSNFHEIWKNIIEHHFLPSNSKIHTRTILPIFHTFGLCFGQRPMLKNDTKIRVIGRKLFLSILVSLPLLFEVPYIILCFFPRARHYHIVRGWLTILLRLGTNKHSPVNT